MRTRIEGQKIEGRYDPKDIRTYSDIEIVNCKIYGGGFGWRYSPDYTRRTTAQRILISNCEVQKLPIGPGLFREVIIENLKSDLIIVYSALFEHVAFKGRCGDWMIHGAALPSSPFRPPPEYRTLWERHYANVDWAIDISQAEFDDFEFRTGAVPAKLVRRDPETQVVVTREHVMEGTWRKLDLDGETKVSLDLLLKEQALDTVLVAPKRRKDVKKLVEDLRKLQAAGIAEPD